MSPAPPSSPVPSVSPPWTCHADFYAIPFYTSTSDLPLLSPSFLHSPLEASHEAPSTSLFSQPVGGIGMLQIIRYKDTPVGPYDEMLIIPGSYKYTRVQKKSAGQSEDVQLVKGKGLRITRIYVSQKETCYNGRKHWNIPKHLADFTFTTNADSSLTLILRPHDSRLPQSSHPFFTTTFHPTRFLPSIPLSLTLASPLIPTTCVLPPLPSSSDPELSDIICGTDVWCAFTPKVKSWKTKFGWFDVVQPSESPGHGEGGGERRENFWPGWERWRMGFCMRDAALEFDEPETWPSGDAREMSKKEH